MSGFSFQTKVGDWTDSSFFLAVLLGLASIPFSLILSWEEATLINGAPMIVTGLLVGYLYNARPTDSPRAGLIAGFVASLGGVMVFATEVVARLSLRESTRLEVVAIPLVLVLLVICLAILVMVFAMVGNWIAKITARFHSIQSHK